MSAPLPSTRESSTSRIERRRLDGSWRPVSATVCGQELPLDELRVARLVLEGDNYLILDRDRRVADSGSIRVDVTAVPMAMDMAGLAGPNAGRTLQAIFTLEGDALMVCHDLEGGQRPSSTEAEREEQVLLVICYERFFARGTS